MNIQILIPFILYLLFMVAIGWFFYVRTKSLSDYILGGRRLNFWVTALSAQASDMSGWLLLGLPGYAYLAGVEAAWIAIGLTVGTFLNWKFVADRLRRFSYALGDSITLPEYFANRFQPSSRALRVVSALFILIFFLIYTASGFVAGAKLFSTVFGFSYIAALLIGALVIVSYTFLGGFHAVAWTDLFQGLIMFFAILIVPALVVIKLGGIGGTWEALHQMNYNYLTLFHDINGAPLSWISILSLLAWGLGYFGQPHILARFMAIRRAEEIPQARCIAMVWVLISLSCAVLIGLVANTVIEPLPTGESETVFMVLVNHMVAPIIAGFFLSAILAAIMSTADSQLLVASSAISEDFYHAFVHKNASQPELVWMSRAMVLLISAIAFVLALRPDSSVLDLVSYAWAGFGAAFGPVVLLSLFWKRMTGKGALAGIIVGGVTVLIWKQLSGGIFELYEIVPGFLLSCAAIVIFSYAEGRPEKGKADI
ncbi:sodium/proline symporter PutP [candidate division KSB1 bacterium]|nr:sodium/proline symporter PutP [candidate division KSB1 bacterium]RQW02407.1 MAG: sodium/proline symporter PutP [candidate division KSB1 bacterium]